MQQIWSDEELRARWIVSDAELGLLKGISEPRRLTLCYYLKYFQLYAQFPTSLGFVSAQVLEFLASQIGSADDVGLPVVPKRTARFYRRQVIAFLDIQHFDKEARAVFLDWLIETVLPTAPNEATSDAAITEWFLSMRMIRPRAKALANLTAKAERRFERILFARIAGRLSDDQWQQQLRVRFYPARVLGSEPDDRVASALWRARCHDLLARRCEGDLHPFAAEAGFFLRSGVDD